MTSFAFTSVANVWPVGTVVGAYVPSRIFTGGPPFSGPALTTATVQADGSLTFSGLAADTEYVAYESGTGRSATFTTAPLLSGGARYFVGDTRADVQAQAAASLAPGTTYSFSLVSASGSLLDLDAGKVA